MNALYRFWDRNWKSLLIGFTVTRLVSLSLRLQQSVRAERARPDAWGAVSGSCIRSDSLLFICVCGDWSDALDKKGCYSSALCWCNSQLRYSLSASLKPQYDRSFVLYITVKEKVCTCVQSDMPHLLRYIPVTIGIYKCGFTTWRSAPTFDVLGRTVHRELSLLWSPIHREVDDFRCHVMNWEALMLPCGLLIWISPHYLLHWWTLLPLVFIPSTSSSAPPSRSFFWTTAGFFQTTRGLIHWR